ncbi:PhoP/PhoQ regulator MgrB [Xenorhabdus koppenhoeferi]|uniref:PhoP/PhoQ regulator MgrB n=1 Tax=Xenorhabdus koppenhoeferi TaxID=351659 RepID=UPI0011603935
MCLIVVCLFLYLLELDMLCERGNGKCELGVCSITRYIYPLHTFLISISIIILNVCVLTYIHGIHSL